MPRRSSKRRKPRRSSRRRRKSSKRRGRPRRSSRRRRRSSKRRKPRRSSRRRRRSSKRRKPSSRRRKPSSKRRKPSSRRRFKMHSWPRWPGGGPPRGGPKKRKGDRPKRKAGPTRSQRRKLAAEKKMLEKWKAWKYNQLVRQVQQEERMRLDREREAWRAASSIQALTRGRQTRGGKAGRALREEKDRKRLMKLQRLFNDWFCGAYPEKCGGGGGGGKKAAYGFGNKFKMQNYKYSSKDFRRGDKFEKIEWIDPSKYYPKNCAVMDKKNKLFPWYPKVATVYPKYMRVLTHIQKRKRASDISVFTNIKYDQIKQIIWKGGGTESERNKKERRKLARKFLTKKTKIPASIINELIDKYLFNGGAQQKKFNKDDFEVVEIERNDGSFLSQVMSGSEVTTPPPRRIINIETFQQYIINNRLITVLGELHNKKSCLRPERGDATPAQYIDYRIKQNPNHIKVLLEYFGDKSAREFSRQQGMGLSKCGNLVQIEETIPKKYIKKTDSRKILGIYLCYLYTNEIDKINITNLNKIYLKPIGIVLKNFGKYLEKNKRDYNQNELKYFTSYIHEKNHMYDYLLKNYDKIPRQQLVQSLQKIWVELADLDILKEILKKNNSIFEYIIIIGMAHSKHLYSIFSKTIKVNKKIRNGSISLKGIIEALI